MSNIITKLKTCVFIFQIDTADLNYLKRNSTVDFVKLSHDNKRRFYGWKSFGDGFKGACVFGVRKIPFTDIGRSTIMDNNCSQLAWRNYDIEQRCPNNFYKGWRQRDMCPLWRPSAWWKTAPSLIYKRQLTYPLSTQLANWTQS